MNQLPIAVDFGVGALKVLQIAPGDPPTLVAAAALPTPDELIADPVKRIAFQIEALPKLVLPVGFRGKRAVCAIPAAQAFCKHMQFQLEPGVTAAGLVRSALPAALGCDASALVFRHIEVGQVGRGSAGAKTEVICMAAARDMVERLMRALKDAKLDPVGMHIEYTATLRAFDSITRRQEDAGVTSLYMDIGAGTTKVTIAHGRDLVFARTIDLGGRHLDLAVAKQLNLSVAEARSRRLAMAQLVPQPAPAAAPEPVGSGLAILAAGERAAGRGGDAPVGGSATAVLEERREGRLPSGFTPDLGAQPRMDMAPAFADLSEPLEILTDEISMCLRYHETMFPGRRISRAIFVGGEARHLGLCQHIAKVLKLPAQVADPMAGVARTGSEPTAGVDFTKAQPGWAMTLGLCQCPTDL
jgi:Tfp pilus assembly PilM family ATPase